MEINVVTHEVMAACVGDCFVVPDDVGGAWLLSSVSDARETDDTVGFSLQFTREHGSFGRDQGLVTLQHPRLGSFELFVVAIGPDTVEAIVNQRIVHEASA